MSPLLTERGKGCVKAFEGKVTVIVMAEEKGKELVKPFENTTLKGEGQLCTTGLFPRPIVDQREDTLKVDINAGLNVLGFIYCLSSSIRKSFAQVAPNSLFILEEAQSERKRSLLRVARNIFCLREGGQRSVPARTFYGTTISSSAGSFRSQLQTILMPFIDGAFFVEYDVRHSTRNREMCRIRAHK